MSFNDDLLNHTMFNNRRKQRREGENMPSPMILLFCKVQCNVKVKLKVTWISKPISVNIKVNLK